MSTFSQRKVWHSWLRQASPVVVRFTSDPFESDRNPGQMLVYFKVRGDNGIVTTNPETGEESRKDTYYYAIEQGNEDQIINRIESVGKGQWVKVEATGRDEDADLVISKPSKSEMASTNGSSSASVSRGTHSRGSLQEDYGAVLEVVDNLGLDPTSESGQRHAATLFIQWARANFSLPLTPEDAEEPEPKVTEEDVEEPQADEDQIEALEEHLDNLEWEGEAHDENDRAAIQERIESLLEGDDQPVNITRSMLQWCDNEVEYQEIRNESELPF